MEGEREGGARERSLKRVDEIISGISAGIHTEVGKTDRRSARRKTLPETQ
jgi:hypothetical protein